MTTIDGLPAHVLLVHAVAVLIPLSAILLVLVAVWPAARRRLSLFTAGLAGFGLITVPITTDAGEWLEHHVAHTPLVQAHTELGDSMLPWAIGLFAVAAAIAVRELPWVRARGSARSRAEGPGAATATPRALSRTVAHGFGGRAVGIFVAALALIVAVGSIVTVYRIGDSGARAAWTGNFSQQAIPSRQQIPGAGG